MKNTSCIFFAYMLLVLVTVNAQSVENSVRINELMASNASTITDENGDYSDWIELFNPTNSSVNLEGWILTDDKEDIEKWRFPSITLSPGEYLIIFASGKNKRVSGGELHTNFKLSSGGEYLALIDNSGNFKTQFDPAYPEYGNDISYGYFDHDYIAFTNPTPGSENTNSDNQLLPAPVFNHKHGYYDSAFHLEITTDLINAQIYFTTDGSEPTETNGQLYNLPFLINGSSIIRAITVKQGGAKSKITTATYLFIEDVIRQPNNPDGYPTMWGPYVDIPGNAIADYGMDPDITRNPQYDELMDDALLSLPVLSIVTDKNNLFLDSTDPDKGGVYIYTGAPGNEIGKGWERPASIEFFDNEGKEDLQVDCGLQLHGGHSRRAEKSAKHSFRLCFKSEYGPSKLSYPLLGEGILNEYNEVTLRAGFGNTWNHWTHAERARAQYLRDVWAKDTQLAMGQPSGRGRFVHLYLNKIYWGIYNLTETIDKYYSAYYLGGNEDEYDIIKDYSEIAEGNDEAWNAMWNFLENDMSSNENYQRFQGNNPDGTPNPDYEAYLDVVNFIDYMVMNFYGGNTDWDHHNWIAIRNRVNPDKGFKFFSWDAEHVLKSLNEEVIYLNNSRCPSGLFQKLMDNRQFQMSFADRVQLHCKNGGVLTPESASERWMTRINEIEMAIIAESARWGDYRRDVHPWAAGPYELYTKNDHWIPALNFLMNDYFPNRTDVFITQLKTAGYIPLTNAPEVFINEEPMDDRTVQPGDVVSLSVGSGTIYYTLDGTDPYNMNNDDVATGAIRYSNPIEVTSSLHFKARTVRSNDWSPLTDIILSVPNEIHNLKITEIHYHPLPEEMLDGEFFEFIELQNSGESVLDLSETRFVDGITYTFPVRTILNPGEFIVLAENDEYFYQRYGFNAFDEYKGSLDNSGERIVLVSETSDTLLNIRYNDKSPWPVTADGEGYSLVLKDNPTNDLNDPVNWRSSDQIHGSPGRWDESSSTDISDDNYSVTRNFKLAQNYPNPFNPSTRISYVIPRSSFVTLKVYDILGREIVTLVNEFKNQGEYSIDFDIRKLSGKTHSKSSGIYFYRLTSGEYTETKKMMLLK